MSWWVEGGVNYLSGIPGDLENPAVLPDDWILDFLMKYPVAREDFEKMVPTLSAGEQERLTNLVKNNPLVNHIPTEDMVVSDYIQAKEIAVGVRTRIIKPRPPK